MPRSANRTVVLASRARRSIYQTLQLVCAHCGARLKLSNGGETSKVLSLADGVLWFNCPNCHERHDLPFFDEDANEHA